MELIKTITVSKEPVGFEFLQYDSKWVLISDGRTGLYAWDATVTEPYQVQDLVPYLPDNNAGAGISLSLCPNVPAGRYLTKYRNRVFFADPITSRVFYSGTRTDFEIDEQGEEDDRPIRPWELWNINLDLSRVNPGYGGSMVIGNRSQLITGLAGIDQGLLVFKENEILLWTWPENAAPHEVELGAYASPVVQGIGLVNHETLAADGEVIYFLGRRGEKDLGVFRLFGGEISDVSYKIPSLMNDIANYDLQISRPYGIISNGYYLLGIDRFAGGEPKFELAYDIAMDVWIQLETPSVHSVAKIPGFPGIVAGGNDGRLYRYPSSIHYDQTVAGNVPITYGYTGPEIDAGTRVNDKKFRMLWTGIDVMNGDQISHQTETVNIDVAYEDSTDTKSFDTSGTSLLKMFLSKRALRGVVTIYGSAMNGIRIRSAALAWRARRTK